MKKVDLVFLFVQFLKGGMFQSEDLLTNSFTHFEWQRNGRIYVDIWELNGFQSWIGVSMSV
jgi:hypothetical protein